MKSRPEQSGSRSSQPPAGQDSQRELLDELLDPRCYPHPVKKVRLIETHISWVLLAGRYAYKIKKSLDLGFLDYSSLASRRHYCEEEVRLNRRLAPQIYLGTVPIGGNPRIRVPGPSPAREYAVLMHRFPFSRQFDRLVARDKLMPRHVDNLATSMAHFHAGLPADTSATGFGAANQVRSAVSQALARLETLLADGTEDTEESVVAALRRASDAEYAGCKEQIVRRRVQGFVRECHGDLHLGNIVLFDGQPVPFDGIEFDPALRWIDVVSEIAFPVMDLLHYRRHDLAFRFLNAYLEETGDYGGVALLPFYTAYRAAVRAMVDATRATQPGLSKGARKKKLAQCSELVALAEKCLTRREPALVITHGLPGSGKTTFSQAALERLQAIRIRSDVERKRLHGLSPMANSGSLAGSLYSAEATQRTFARLHDLARELLGAGMPVIVDAAFLRRDEREQFRRLAHELGVPFVIASMKTSIDTMRERIAQRQIKSNDASEADLAVLELLRNKQEKLSPQEQACAIEFDNEEDVRTGDVQAWEQLYHRLAAP
jgi:aminoglycoside phosphotransferase family enzyme/predicted kinase